MATTKEMGTSPAAYVGTAPVPWQDPPSARKFYRREEGGVGVFGVDSEEEGDHESSYDGPDSDAEDAEAWDADQREIDEAEMEASYLAERDKIAMGYYTRGQ